MTRMFTAQFPLNKEATLDDIIGICKEWTVNMRKDRTQMAFNSDKTDEIIYGLESHNDSVETEEDSITLGKYEDIDTKLAGIRVVRKSSSGIWTSDVVAYQQNDITKVGIAVDYESSTATNNIPEKATKPVIIRKLLERYSGGMDGKLKVRQKPLIFRCVELNYATEIISCQKGNTLPVVYVSAKNNSTNVAERYNLDIFELAKTLEGLAHIVVEPSRAFSFDIKKITNGQNVYNGDVGIYWPNNGGCERVKVSDMIAKLKKVANATRNSGTEVSIESHNEYVQRLFLDSVSSKVCNAVKNQCLERNLKYDNIVNLVNVTAIKNKSASENVTQKQLEEVFQLAEIYHNEAIAKDKELNEQKEENFNLHSKVVSLESQLSTYKDKAQKNTAQILDMPPIQELFPNEMAERVLRVLNQASSEDNTRHNEVITAIIEYNSKLCGQNSQFQEMETKIKELFKGYRTMSGEMKNKLSSMGFIVEDGGKHYCLYHKNNPKYSVAISKTASDIRSGLNTVSKIKRELL